MLPMAYTGGVLGVATMMSINTQLQDIHTPLLFLLSFQSPLLLSATSLSLGGLLDRTVYVEEKDKDRYGRVVAVLWSADGTNANAAMVCGGHAWWYKRYARFDSELRDCQKEAQAESLGLWAAAEPVGPWEWRKR